MQKIKVYEEKKSRNNNKMIKMGRKQSTRVQTNEEKKW